MRRWVVLTLALSLCLTVVPRRVDADVLPEWPYRRGDANTDRQVDIAEAIFLLLHLFEGEMRLRNGCAFVLRFFPVKSKV